MTLTDRQCRVLRAVVAIYDHPVWQTAPELGVRAFHVRYFGIEQCVREIETPTIDAYLRSLWQEGFLTRPEKRRAEYLPTDEGRLALSDQL